jgi:hypothetical protein
MGLTARIRTRDGWAVPHAVVTVTDMTGAQVLRVEADAEGAVRDANPLPPGAYTVIVTAVGYAPAAASVIVTASGRAEVGTVTLARQGVRRGRGPSTRRTPAWPPSPSTWGSPACTAGSHGSPARS